jgi:tetratricopeptide (TPR) repeat protein
LRLGCQQWLAYMSLGATHACRFDWKAAGDAFNSASNISREQTRYHFWYLAYLTALRKDDEVDEILMQRIRDYPQDDFARMIAALLLYISGDHVAADWIIINHLAENVETYYGDGENHTVTMNIAVNTDLDTFDEVWPERGRKYFTCTCKNWLVDVLRTFVSLARDLPSLARRHTYAMKPCFREGLVEFAIAVAYSVGVAPAASEQEPTETPSASTVVLPERESDPFHLALAYMSVGEHQSAITMLEQACDEHHPLTVWLHRWPVLDALREHPEFQTLIERMNLPETV